jgi:RNA polymerase sigma-70 factor (ECF subfamily)
LLYYKLLLARSLLLEEEFTYFGMELPDEQIALRLTKRDEAAFEQVFKTHYKNLYAYAFTMLKDEDEAHEVVPQVFFKVWERSEQLSFSGPVAAYLYRAVHNESLNFLKHQKVKAGHQMHVAYIMKDKSEQAHGKLTGKELEKKFREALNELPEQCRTVFQLSRFENLKYREIADKLDISVKTVENHMVKALKLLRTKLVDFLTVLFILSQL